MLQKIQDFIEQKRTIVATGSVEEPSYSIIKKNWNPDTGEQNEDTFTEIKVQELRDKRAELEKQ